MFVYRHHSFPRLRFFFPSRRIDSVHISLVLHFLSMIILYYCVHVRLRLTYRATWKPSRRRMGESCLRIEGLDCPCSMELGYMV
ncbi:hypothetical protein BDV59DRAFT_148095 [Aspergillus ambiguus]|uniref:uncharacterized protein n=1 Tax=Aspergillus ambiguus TaxID=176160 RepID=UPI003CCDCF6D